MAQLLASDANNREFVGASNPDDALTVRFYIRPIKNEFKSSQEGRPIFEDILYTEIATPGIVANQIDRPTRESDKIRFARQWSYYQATQGGDARDIGTPVTQWAFLSPAQCEELKALKFRTVESIANASDLAITAIGMVGGVAPTTLRQRAQAYIAAAHDKALPEHQAQELAKRDQMMKEMEERHAREMADLRALIAGKQENKPAKRVKPEISQELKDQYKAKFGKFPHHMMAEETVKQQLEAG